jgi:hypothetical protein
MMSDNHVYGSRSLPSFGTEPLNLKNLNFSFNIMAPVSRGFWPLIYLLPQMNTPPPYVEFEVSGLTDIPQFSRAADYILAGTFATARSNRIAKFHKYTIQLNMSAQTLFRGDTKDVDEHRQVLKHYSNAHLIKIEQEALSALLGAPGNTTSIHELLTTCDDTHSYQMRTPMRYYDTRTYIAAYTCELIQKTKGESTDTRVPTFVNGTMSDPVRRLWERTWRYLEGIRVSRNNTSTSGKQIVELFPTQLADIMSTVRVPLSERAVNGIGPKLDLDNSGLSLLTATPEEFQQLAAYDEDESSSYISLLSPDRMKAEYDAEMGNVQTSYSRYSDMIPLINGYNTVSFRTAFVPKTTITIVENLFQEDGVLCGDTAHRIVNHVDINQVLITLDEVGEVIDYHDALDGQRYFDDIGEEVNNRTHTTIYKVRFPYFADNNTIEHRDSVITNSFYDVIPVVILAHTITALPTVTSLQKCLAVMTSPVISGTTAAYWDVTFKAHFYLAAFVADPRTAIVNYIPSYIPRPQEHNPATNHYFFAYLLAPRDSVRKPSDCPEFAYQAGFDKVMLRDKNDPSDLNNANALGLRKPLKHPLLVNMAIDQEELARLYLGVHISSDAYHPIQSTYTPLQFGADDSGIRQADDIFYGMTDAAICNLIPPTAFRPWIEHAPHGDPAGAKTNCKAVGVLEVLTNENQTVYTTCHSGTYHSKFKLPVHTSISKDGLVPQTGFEKYVGQEIKHLNQPASFDGLRRGFNGSF